MSENDYKQVINKKSLYKKQIYSENLNEKLEKNRKKFKESISPIKKIQNKSKDSNKKQSNSNLIDFNPEYLFLKPSDNKQNLDTSKILENKILIISQQSQKNNNQSKNNNIFNQKTGYLQGIKEEETFNIQTQQNWEDVQQKQILQVEDDEDDYYLSQITNHKNYGYQSKLKKSGFNNQTNNDSQQSTNANYK
ncbi:hypothetical protein PPERSA_11607 [Pseudocohnilembus persalinus]|uniref:Uncharacterized protein n=1 Tax=Pseudocohnilembus persalinus TaxID=266149 RepID=A0A0V0Q9W1_PSEPJ|nr:hypothetical protein PPERSA_11607 [Pseudocohnilembus persalinus]|eukprot:KRW99006.1 hypothetical protein PPERSA_11607 [Pseudocohnilembus persalinus]